MGRGLVDGSGVWCRDCLSGCCCSSVQRARAFTLVELLVVIAVLALLLSVLLPSLGRAQRAGRSVQCLGNIRSLLMAHVLYVQDHDGCFVDVGLGHGGGPGDPERSWISTLSEYYGSSLAVRSPGDHSDYWPIKQGGAGLTLGGQPRRTSYGMNNWLSRTYNPGVYPNEPFDRQHRIPSPSVIVQFLLMTEEGPFAVSDHTHAEGWDPGPIDAPPALASGNIKTHAWGGTPRSWQAVSNYGFLDGHASGHAFRSVFTNREENRFDPSVAQ